MKGLTPEELRLLIRSVGTHRGERALSPVEVAQLIQRSLAAGETRQGCAQSLRIGTTQVSTFVKLLDLAPEIRQIAEWGRASESGIAFSSMAEISRLTPAEQVKAAHAMIEHKLSWKEAVQLVQISQRSGKTIDEAIGSVVKQRPSVERRYVFVGSITSDETRQHLKQISQQHRDELLRRSLEKLLGPTSRFSGHLGTDHFTIVGPEPVNRHAKLTPDEFEERFAQELATQR
jgi:hypothetical protein